MEVLNPNGGLGINPAQSLGDDFSAPMEFFNQNRRIEDIDQKTFENTLFTVFDVSREPLGTVLTLKCHADDNVPLHFRLTLRGMWTRTPIDHGDLVRVIGKFTKLNNYTLTLDDADEDTHDGEANTIHESTMAKFIILEPKIMISTTNIITSFPCVRKSLFSDTFRNTNSDFSYPLVIGNIIHDSFEVIIQEMNFDEKRLDEIFTKAI